MKLQSFPKELATMNPHKRLEWGDILANLQKEYGADADIAMLEEDKDLLEIQGIDVVSVVIRKAHDAYEKFGRSVLVEDAGLDIEALNGFPGALYAPVRETLGNDGLCDSMARKTNRKIRAVAAVAFVDASGKNVNVSTGEMLGTMPKRPDKKHFFGFDNIVIPQGFNVALSHLTAAQKNKISHRRKAIVNLFRRKWTTYPIGYGEKTA